MFRLSALTVGIVLDWILGEPRWLLHPVVLMGRLIGRTEAWLQKARPGKEESSGVLLVLIVLLLGLLVPGGILAAAAWWEKGRGPLCWSLCAFWSFQLLAARSLYRESGKVREALEQEDEGRARKALSMIVGRDVERLDQAGIVRAGVETVAENTSDGVVAPMLYIAAFGILGGFFYKAVNTMDSMVGYKDERYRLFGRAAARLDDLCNLLPARITGCLWSWLPISPGSSRRCTTERRPGGSICGTGARIQVLILPTGRPPAQGRCISGWPVRPGISGRSMKSPISATMTGLWRRRISAGLES